MTVIRQNSRSAIIEAAFVVFSADPSASLDAVAKQAGVGRATLHRQFKGRDDLMAALASAAVGELNTAVDAATKDSASYADALQGAIRALVPLGHRHWFLSHFDFSRTAKLRQMFEDDRREIMAAIDGAKAEAVFAPDIPSAWIAEAFDTLIYTAWMLIRNEAATPTQAADFIWRMLTTGLNGDQNEP